MKLVPGRECGECVECCRVLPINTDVLEKPTGLLCKHCEGGCTVYEKRPGVCSGWFCGWRYVDYLGDEWRPDKTGVVLRMEGEGVTLLVSRITPFIASLPFCSLLATWMKNGVPVRLSLLGPAGHFPAIFDPAPHLADELARRDLPAFSKKIVDLFEKLIETHVWETDGLAWRSSIVAE